MQLVAVYPFLAGVYFLFPSSPQPPQLPENPCTLAHPNSAPLFPKNPIPQLASMVSQTSSLPGSILSGHSLPQVTLLHPHPGSFRGLEDWPLTRKALSPPGLLGNRFQSKSVALGCRAGWARFLLSEKPHPYPCQRTAPNCRPFSFLKS